MSGYLSVNDPGTPSLVFLRRHQVADMMVDLAFNEYARQRMPEMKGLLMDALHELPPECFIADDWSDILVQVMQALLSDEPTLNALLMPTALKAAISQLNARLSRTHPGREH
jgi:hypothetical protein